MKKSLPVVRLLTISAILLSSLSLAGCLDGSGSSSSKASPGESNPPAPAPTLPVAADLVPITESDLVQAVRPISESLVVNTNKKLAVTFNQPMDADTINGSTFLVQGETGPAIVGVVTYDADTRTAIFTPDSDLNDDTLYTATLTTEVKDAKGVALEENLSWQFTTGNTKDELVPTAKFALLDGATDVSISRNITATFSESIDPTTLTNSSFTLQTGEDFVDGVVSYVGTTAIFNPVENLAHNTPYTATLTDDITDLANPAKALAEQSVSFTTEDAQAPAAEGPDPVLLGTAGNFVILSKTGITTTDGTKITGDMGVSPIVEESITGFGLVRHSSGEFSTSSLVTGKIYAANLASPTPTYLTTAISDMETAFNDAAGRSIPKETELGAGNITGLTLTPGLYKWGTSVSASSDFTFDGGANDVWILQIGQDLLLETGVAVQLKGGANAENIFWQVKGNATLGTYSMLQGILLTEKEIVMETGATLVGRALSQTAVTLDAVKATQP